MKVVRVTKRLCSCLILTTILLTIVVNYFYYRNVIPTSKHPYALGETDTGQLSPWITYRNTRVEYTTDASTVLEGPLVWSNCTPAPTQYESWDRVNRKFVTVLLNLIRGSHNVTCDKHLVTLTTHGDYRFLDNLVPVVERWRAPVSIALYVPYDDVNPTLHRIAYIRECTTPLVKEWISFHLYALKKYSGYSEMDIRDLWNQWQSVNVTKLCSVIPGFGDQLSTSRNQHKINYPVNIGRNLAREAAMTKYILASDIELYPSPDFVPKFFEMLKFNQAFFEARENPYVFVFPIFEVEANVDLPETKEQLVDLLSRNDSVPFHKYVCPECHTIPNYDQWLTTTSQTLQVFYIAKRQVPYEIWEPIYVSTNDVPLYDERLSWEGLRDKMPQSYKLCLMDYDFMIFDSAFLVHKPGIKKTVHETEEKSSVIQRNNRIIYRIVDEVTRKLGNRKGCVG